MMTLLQTLPLGLVYQLLREDMPDANADVALGVEVEVNGTLQALILRSVKVHMLGPLH